MNFTVNPYSIDTLIQLISQKSQASEELIKSKHHSVYFEEYFRNVNAKTIILEEEYIDKDYLEDFASYYVRCFDSYDKKCTRLHFFSTEFTLEDFKKVLEKSSKTLSVNLLQKHYLGFVVIKPLPSTVIGRTCLRTYPHSNHRFFPIIREYQANLYGIVLTINSIAFQEQDSVVSACATSALWSIFHGTGILFQHQIYSPAEITKKASEYLPTGTLEARIFPNKGLSIEQMAYAIRDLKLEPYLVNPTSQFILQSTIYAYTRCKIPSLLGVTLYDMKSDIPIGKHAVAVTGYSIGNKAITTSGTNNLHLKSSRMDKIYVHDDQVGPFARTEIDNKTFTFTIGTDSFDSYSIRTYWADRNGVMGNVRAIPTIILIPLYHKIRIPFASILNSIIYFNSFIEFFRNNSLLKMDNFFDWDIYLTTINDFKTNFYEESLLSGAYLSSLLTSPLPHFLWRATATINDIPVLDLLFDATDIEQGDFLLEIIEYDKTISNQIRNYSKLDPVFEDFRKTAAQEIISYFRNK